MDRVLLPNNVVPMEYDLVITPDMNKFTFDGEVSIKVDVIETTSTITLHSKELNIYSATFGGQKAVRMIFDLQATTVELVFDDSLPLGGGVLRIVFAGIINDQMAGFYRSKYVDSQGADRTMVSTQFETLDARRAFPCWDEPSRKAVFNMTMVVPLSLEVLSNTEPISCESIPNQPLKRVIFEPTPKMSTYLLAFIVAELDYIQTYSSSGVRLRVYTTPGKASTGKFALESGVKALETYEKLFNVKYPLRKIDCVAIPEFAAGAMENWGLITYREVDLLIDEKTVSANQLQRVSRVVCHEFSHQWFGNLVTMAWWNDLWLNEGFASWCENYAMHKQHPEWRVWDQFIGKSLESALSLDAQRSSHPIQVPIKHAEEVEQIFDAISYLKGSSIVRMAYAILGEEAFTLGIRNYIKTHAYGNTDSSDLWKSWGEAYGGFIVPMMTSWTEQTGFPLIRIISEEWTSTEAIFTISQERFLSDGGIDDNPTTWIVPIRASSFDSVTTFFMDKKEMVIKIPLLSQEDFVSLNYGVKIPMRVLYGKESMRRLQKGVETATIPSIDRAGLLSDATAMCKAGYLDHAKFFRFLWSYRLESDPIVWNSIYNALSSLFNVMSGDKTLKCYLTQFSKNFVDRMLKIVGWTTNSNSGHLGRQLQSDILGLVEMFSSSENVQAARKLVDQMINNPDDDAIPNEIKCSVMRMAVQYNTSLYDRIKNLHTVWESDIEKKRIYSSLGAVMIPDLQRDALEWAISGNVKKQDFFYVFGGVSETSPHITWNFFKDNFERIRLFCGEGHNIIDGCIILSCNFSSFEDADDIEQFFKEHPCNGSERKVAQIVEATRTRAKWLGVIKKEVGTEEFWKSF